MRLRNTVVGLAFLALAGNTQAQEAPKIKWMSFEEAVIQNAKAPRKMFIDVYTEWCGWCKRMDASTFKDSVVADYMNKHFYAIKLDAERKDTVVFNNHIFAYKPEYKSHELAISLLNGQMAYPSFVILDEQFVLLSPLSGYQSVNELMKSLTFFGDNLYKSKSWEEFNK